MLLTSVSYQSSCPKRSVPHPWVWVSAQSSQHLTQAHSARSIIHFGFPSIGHRNENRNVNKLDTVQYTQ